MMDRAILVLRHTPRSPPVLPTFPTQDADVQRYAEMEPFNTLINFRAYVTLGSALGTTLLLLISTVADNINS